MDMPNNQPITNPFSPVRIAPVGFLRRHAAAVIIVVACMFAVVGIVYATFLSIPEVDIPRVLVHHKSSVSDWKTYSNTEYGFEFKYPNKWNLNNISQRSAKFAIGLDSKLKEHESNDLPYEVEIRIYPSIKDLDAQKLGVHNLTEFINKYSSLSDPQFQKVQNITIAEDPGFKAESGPNTFAGGDYYYFSHQDNIYEIFDFGQRPELNQILSTFKFNGVSNLPAEIVNNSTFKQWLAQKKLSYGIKDDSFTMGKTEPITIVNTIATITCGDKSIPNQAASLTACINSGDEPDSDLYLIDKKAKISERLLSCGTPCFFENGFWLDNSRFVFLETDFDKDYSDTRFDIYIFRVYEYDFTKKNVTSWNSTLRIQE
jgi:hypothetical protein